MFKREKYSSDTEWYWVPAKPAGAEARPAIQKLLKPKKDAPIRAVIEFAAKQAGQGLQVDDLMKRFEELMKENPPPTTTPMPPMDPPLGGDEAAMEGLQGMGDLEKLAGGADKAEL